MAPIPATSPSNWVNEADYPADARAAGQSGVVGFRLDIDITGRVTGCTITETSGSPSLDVTTCTLMSRRARFHPARGPNAEPIASLWRSRVHWDLPYETEPSFAPWSQLSLFEIGKDRRLEACRTRSLNRAPAAVLELCDRVKNGEQLPELERFRAAIGRARPGLVAVEFGANPETLPPSSRRTWEFRGRRLRSLDTVTFALTPDGRVGRCDTPAHSGDVPATLDLCGLLRKAYEQGAPRNAVGAGPGVAWFAISTGSGKAIIDFLPPPPPLMR
jgi:TonB family protein